MTQTLVRELAQRISGDVRSDDGTRAAYASDASNHRVIPTAVVYPADVDDISTTVRLCADAAVPITSRGTGTNVAGSAIGSGVVIDYSRYLNRVISVDPETATAVVEPGVILDALQDRASEHGLRFGPDPSTHDRCTLGGMIGTNACGTHSIAWGTTADSVVDLNIVGADGAEHVISQQEQLSGKLLRLRDDNLAAIRTELGRFSRQGSGYSLQYLLPEHGFDIAKSFTGSEGTCAITTRATLSLVSPPKHRALVIAGYTDDIAAATAAVPLATLSPLAIEGIDDNLVSAFDNQSGVHRRPRLPAGRAWLLIELGHDDPDGLSQHCQLVRDTAQDAGALESVTLSAPEDQRAFWRIRERGAGLATRAVDGSEAWPGWEDAAVPPERLASYLSHFHALLDRYDVRGVIYGHFGDGCVHVRITHDLLSAAGRATYRSFQEDAADIVIDHDGSLSGEHGDGRSRSELLSRMYSPELLRAFGGFKDAFDPQGLFNPGVLVDPEPLDANMRLAINRPHTTNLKFAYTEDDGDWGKAMRRCVGVGACRKESGGGMCPSFRATKDERHSTRGRSRVLSEMLNGQFASDGWRSDEVHDALDLCLSCKACANECPVSVDMATYKSEFLSKHYRGRLRPRSHYSMGHLPRWLTLARRIPKLSNVLLKSKFLGWLAGIDGRRSMPKLSSSPWRNSGTVQQPGSDITLWIDTFTASFEPEIAKDAYALLVAAGHTVTIVGPDVCCGLTWVSTGQLNAARRVAGQAISQLSQSSGPIVTLEPSCAAALRDDVPGLLQTSQAHEVAGRITTLAEVVADSDLEFAPLDQVAIGQFHCHQRAVLGTQPDRQLLERLGVQLTSVDEGCCGLAGNFGFEKGHYDVSVTCAEQSFLPELERQPEAMVLADGFSCRLQIRQLGGKEPVHLAQLLRGSLLPSSKAATDGRR